jgi:hypothetical protein
LINTQNSGCRVSWPQQIECDSNEILDLKQQFLNISNNLDSDHKKFNYFYLIAPTNEIPENVFIDIQFEKIYIYESNFTRINSNAFNSTSFYIETFSHNAQSTSKLSNSPPNYDFYEAFSSLVNAVEIDINLDSDTVHVIPDYAFSNSSHQQKNLEIIDFNGNYTISRIGNFAFHSMPFIRIIGFNVYSIQTISEHAFDFQFSSDVSLKIDLSGTQLDENCLESSVFQSALRKMHLVLSIKHKYCFLEYMKNSKYVNPYYKMLITINRQI